MKKRLILILSIFAIFIGLVYAATFSDSIKSEFDLGTYNNTLHNGTEIILSGTNVSGTYTSRIFDATSTARWNNLSSYYIVPTKDYLYAVDAQANTYWSQNFGVNWNIKNVSYSGSSLSDTQDIFSDSNNNLYIIKNTRREIYRSNDRGITWTMINGSFANKDLYTGTSYAGIIYVFGATGAGWKSSDSGVTWTAITDFNGAATNNPWGATVNLSGTVYVVDRSGAVYSSSDSGSSWSLKNSNYGRTSDTQDMFSDLNGNLYIISSSNKEIWKSTDNGVFWSVVNNTFANLALLAGGSDSLGNLYVISGTSAGNVFRSSNGGVSWTLINDSYNYGDGAARGLTYLTERTNLTFQVKNCSLLDCSDGTWQAKDLTNINLTGRYFHYKIDFTSPDSSITPSLASVSIDYTILNTAPIISIASPQNSQSFSIGETIRLNFSAFDNDNNLQSCWYKINSGSNVSLLNCANTTILASSIGTGNHIIYVYANDSLGLIGNNSVSFSITNTAPIIVIASPQEGATYGYNTSLVLSYSISDNDGNLQSCWYNFNNGVNISLSGCANTTFNVSGSGAYTLKIYANDSLGSVGIDSTTFSVAVGSPTIILNSPIDSYLNYKNVVFSYTPTDIDLNYCELWGNFNEQFKLNQTDNSPINGSVNNFYLSLNDGTYLWNIRCVDNASHSAFNGNKSFYIDTINPSLSLSEPTGAKISRTISASWSVTDNSPVSCRYNVYRGENLEVGNTSVDCSLNSISFSVTLDTNFVFNFYVNDSAGNSNKANSSFSVDTLIPVVPPSGGSSGSSSGGGGGFLVNISSSGKLSVSQIGSIIARKGDKKTLSLNVKNIGKIFLNKCKLIASEETKSWIYSNQASGIAPGETLDFNFDLNIPEEINSGDYLGKLEIKCDEGNNVQNISVSIPGLDGVSIEGMIQKGRILIINYTFDNSNFVGNSVAMDIWISDEAGNEVKKIQDKFDINKEGLIQRNVKIEVADLSGIYYVNFALSSNLEDFVRQSILLGKAFSTGFAIFNIPIGKNVIYSIFVLFVGIAVFFIWMRQGKADNSKQKKHKGLLRKRAMLIVLCFVPLVFILGINRGLTGFVVGGSETINKNILGVAIFVFIVSAILLILRKRKTSYLSLRNSSYLKDLMNKLVYNHEGRFLGKVKDIILGDCKIEKIRIKFNFRSRRKFHKKGIFIKYKVIDKIGDVVILKNFEM
ncbi:MAG: PRC-barrel domain-containing protein [Nanoarchaeota archaeon]